MVSEEEVARYVAEAYEAQEVQSWRVEQEDGTVLEGEEVCWQEERWVLRPKGAHERALRQLESRLRQAEAALGALNEWGKRRYGTQEALKAQVEAIGQRYGVADLLEVS